MRKIIFVLILSSFCCASCSASELPPEWSGVYPHLAFFNSDGECGTGAVVPWAGKLWTVTYSPHKPKGSDDKLYEIDDDLNMTIRDESIGGTPANRMIHRESKQLFIGPYAIDQKGNVRAIPYAQMQGRPTGTARHLSDPAGKVYYATMEEGFYEVDVRTLEVTELYPDGNYTKNMAGDLLPGYHGKGLFSGQGRLVYANNGENSPLARRRPDIPSGCLAEWDGKDWNVVRRNQFTEVVGPGGIFGSSKPATDPIWAVGWDNRSLILMLLDGGKWYSFRLPKASHCYDGAHGWNTEWPRIREIGQDDLLMTMHGMFWHFPETFSMKDTSGIRPRSSYLAVVADFCQWKDRIVLACDVTAKSEFLNTRKAKGKIAGPGQSQSNLRFINPDQLDKFGTSIGRGAVWLNDPVSSGDVSDSFLFTGFNKRGVHLAHDSKESVKFTFETDIKGNGNWSVLRTVSVDASGYKWISFSPSDKGQWIRIRLDRDCAKATAYFQYSNAFRGAGDSDIFDGLVTADCKDASGGLIRAREADLGLHFAAVGTSKGKLDDVGYYEIGVDMKLKRVDDPANHKWLKEKVAVPQGIITVDAASALYIDGRGNRYRLPKGDASFDKPGILGLERIDREVCTERDVFNCHGTFYELPAENAGGFSLIRPITTHNRHITDYCSWRGLLVMSGIAADSPKDNKHIIRSDDGQCALWVGAVDDLWRLGKPKGQGGAWKNTFVRADEPSDPYLMTGYDRKSLTLSVKNKKTITIISVEVDIDGNGNWKPYRSFEVIDGKPVRYEFPEAFGAYWVRFTASQDAVATAQLVYD